MKDQTNTKPRKRWLRAILLLLLCLLTLSILSRTQDELLNEEQKEKISAAVQSMKIALSEVADEVKFAAKEAAVSMEKFFDGMQGKNTSKREPDEAILPTEPKPDCPPFEGELDVYTAYSEDNVLISYSDDGEHRATVNYVEVYSTTVAEHQKPLIDYYLEYFHYPLNRSPDEPPSRDFVGKFYIDGKDNVPVYRVWYYATAKDLVPLEEIGTVIAYYTEDGGIHAHYTVDCGDWGDDPDAAWNALIEYLGTPEYNVMEEALQKAVAELIGCEPHEIFTQTKYIVKDTFCMAGNQYKTDYTIFDGIWFNYNLDLIEPAPEEPVEDTGEANTEPEEPAEETPSQEP